MSAPSDGEKPEGGKAPPAASSKHHAGDPEWTSGLKKLYESVVDEPLPDSFKDLLSKLDESDDK